ncbi:MAG TPA: CapA family protein, partial [Stellaceae bacterium]|nr:CapA family protein [Stellaceae bacterium]
MATNMILTGDVNLMNITDAATPFSLVKEKFHAADIVFCNLECCLYQPRGGHGIEHEGFYADPLLAGDSLKLAGVHAVGLANNVNYGEAAIIGS